MACCSRPDIKEGFIGFRCIKVNICFYCQTVEFTGGRLAGVIFDYFLSWFWNGYVTIDEE